MEGGDAFAHKRHGLLRALGLDGDAGIVWLAEDCGESGGKAIVALLAQHGITAEVHCFTKPPRGMWGSFASGGDATPGSMVRFGVCLRQGDLKRARALVDEQQCADLASLPDEDELARLSEQAYEEETGQRPPGS
jgi:hypothetical protein